MRGACPFGGRREGGWKPRFTAEYVAGSPDKSRVKDGSTVIQEMNKADLHQAGGGGSGALATLVGGEAAIVAVERAFDTPDGQEMEMGFDLVFKLSASGADKEIGNFVLSGLQSAFGSSVEFLELFRTSTFSTIQAFQNDKNYPGEWYAPVLTIRSDTYNLSVALCYPAVEYNHSLNFRAPASSTGGRPTSLRFSAAFNHSLSPWFKIPDGQTRVYRLCFRINDRTDTPIGSAADAATEWLWTFRGYQRYFRRLYGKPNYRSMGGFDGRPIASYNSSHASGAYADRWWQNSANNPETTGPPDGYFKFSAFALAKRQLNVDRVIIWALSGWHENEGFNYPFRFASGVFDSDMSSLAQTTVQPALQSIGHGGMQWGLWWGNCTNLDTAADWASPAFTPLDLANPDHVAACFREGDRAVFDWNARVLGLDAFGLFSFLERPGDGFRWLQTLKARYPRVLLITEQALPDIYHVLAPTYFIQPVVGEVPDVFWPHQYINPGNECLFAFTIPPGGPSQAVRASEIANTGYTPLAAYSTTLNEGTVASRRWLEVGESAISEFDRPVRRLTWRSRHFRSRAAFR